MRTNESNLTRFAQNVKTYVDASIQSLQTEILGGVAKNTVVATFKINKAPTTIILNNVSDRVRIDWGDGKGISEQFTNTYQYTTTGDFICTLYNVNNIEQMTFQNRTELTSVAIGIGCPQIRNYAFSGCTNLTSVVIPDTVELIGDEAFYNCNKLTSVDLGRVTTMGKNAFQKTALTAITIPETVTSMGNNVFNGVTTLQRAEYKTSIAIPTGTFAGCTNLNQVVFSDSITTIGSKAFMNTALTSIVIPDSVTTMSANVFYGCTKLTIYCEVEEKNKPSGWATAWYGDVATSKIKWGYFENKDKVQTLIDQAINGALGGSY